MKKLTLSHLEVSFDYDFVLRVVLITFISAFLCVD